MPRIVTPLIALALFIGLGFVTRHYYREWMTTSVQKAGEAKGFEKDKFKPVETNFDGVQFDKPVTSTFDVNPPATNPPRK
jgi:hypothetical protein